MRRTTIEELRDRKLAAMTDAERVEFDEAVTSARLAKDKSDNPRNPRDGGPEAT